MGSVGFEGGHVGLGVGAAHEEGCSGPWEGCDEGGGDGKDLTREFAGGGDDDGAYLQVGFFGGWGVLDKGEKVKKIKQRELGGEVDDRVCVSEKKAGYVLGVVSRDGRVF